MASENIGDQGFREIAGAVDAAERDILWPQFGNAEFGVPPSYLAKTKIYGGLLREAAGPFVYWAETRLRLGDFP
jgi:hypothetical protein